MRKLAEKFTKKEYAQGIVEFVLVLPILLLVVLGVIEFGRLLFTYSAVAAAINNLGPGLAGVGAHYANINDTAKWILCFAMILGRLEIFTLLVILSPAFWAK